MLERTYIYQGYTIEQYIYHDKHGSRRYFYPAINGNIESTNIKDIIRWIKTLKWMSNLLK